MTPDSVNLTTLARTMSLDLNNISKKSLSHAFLYHEHIFKLNKLSTAAIQAHPILYHSYIQYDFKITHNFKSHSTMIINQFFFLFILFLYNRSQLQPPFPPILLACPPPMLPTGSNWIHCSSISLQKIASLPEIATEHSLTSYNKTRHISFQDWMRQPSRKKGSQV